MRILGNIRHSFYFFSVVSVGVLVSVGVYAQTPTHYRGTACIASLSGQCGFSQWIIGTCAVARFTPPNWSLNSNRTGISLNWGAFTQNFTYASGSLIGAVMRPLQATGISGFVYTYSATGRIVSQSPPNPTTATVFLSNTIAINGFDQTCNATFRFQGQRYPLP